MDEVEVIEHIKQQPGKGDYVSGMWDLSAQGERPQSYCSLHEDWRATGSTQTQDVHSGIKNGYLQLRFGACYLAKALSLLIVESWLLGYLTTDPGRQKD